MKKMTDERHKRQMPQFSGSLSTLSVKADENYSHAGFCIDNAFSPYASN
jgi:hypothetical protein